MKIAFTSCADPIDDQVQIVWNAVSEKEPDYLVLLGDNIYMDYGVGDNPSNGAPMDFSDDKFAQELYTRYRKQSEIPFFKALTQSIQGIFTIWDDHDFAWNNSHGAWNDTHGTNNRKGFVSLNKKKISKGLHLQFREWLNSSQVDNYPEQPSMDELLSVKDPDLGIEYVVDDIPGLRLIMTDGRYYREQEDKKKSTQIFGDNQRNWLKSQLNNDGKVNILCTGVTLDEGSEHWDNYSDYEWIKNDVDLNRTVVLSGDIHKNRIKRHDDLNGLLEATSSGAARPPRKVLVLGVFGEVGNFGILSFDNGIVNIKLFETDDEGNVTLEDEDSVDFS